MATREDLKYTGATGITKIGNRGRHREEKVTPVNSNRRKHTVFSRSKPSFGTKWRASDARCGLTLQPNPPPPQKRNRQTATSNESKPQQRKSKESSPLDNNMKLRQKTVIRLTLKVNVLPFATH